MKPTVSVLLSTYNGEKYIREMIDSILAQDDVSIKLIIRDDGSSDSTKDILKEYGNKITVDFAKNAGVGISFMNLVYFAGEETDYYA
ncbi:MAG: glycosyltransferase, partial [Firmicutes bacterium]|nr:glycosyltransferase [Bacillota bacterium]